MHESGIRRGWHLHTYNEQFPRETNEQGTRVFLNGADTYIHAVVRRWMAGILRGLSAGIGESTYFPQIFSWHVDLEALMTNFEPACFL